MKKDLHKLCVLSLFILFFLFGGVSVAYADIIGGLSVHISPDGVIEPFSVACNGTDAEAYLVYGSNPFYKSVGVIQRRPCLDGFVNFDSYDLNAYLTSSGGAYPEWIQYYGVPQSLAVKDTTGLYNPDGSYTRIINLVGAFNSYDNSVMDPNNTYWPTLASGSSFSFDGSEWSNATLGDGSANATSTSCCSNVLFLPGIESSRLYRERVVGDPEDTLWEPNANSDVQALYLDENGKSLDPNIYTKDVISEAYSTFNIYKSFLTDLDDLKSNQKIINDYSAVPYDWRLSLDDILSSGYKQDDEIYYTKSTSTPYIMEELERLTKTSKTGKVTIIAHSNGGLLTKALIKKLQDTNDLLLSKIDKVILVAVPQLGTPAAFAADLHGYKQGIPETFPLVLSPEVARGFAENSPMAYNLLPSQKYFETVSGSVVTFNTSDSGLSSWRDKFGSEISTISSFNNFLTDTEGKTFSTSTDLKTPSALHQNLLSTADAVHQALDNWNFPQSIKVYEIAGWGIPTTIKGVNYSYKNGIVTPTPTFTIDGDGTVVVPSALWSNDGNVERYWVDLGLYNNSHIDKKHANIMEVDEINNLLNYFLTNTSYISHYISRTSPISSFTGDRLVYSLHSPLTLNLYDNLGNHTGISTTTGQLEEGIPGSYYVEFGEVKYIFTDNLIPVHIVMDGYADGVFTFNITELNGDSLIASTTFKDIPTTADTKVKLDVTSDINTISNMNIDNDGDGTIDFSLTPKINDVVTIPKIPLIVSVENKTILLGSPLPNFVPVINGFINGDTSTSSFSKMPVCTTIATQNSPVGSYSIICGGGILNSNKYEIGNYLNGTLTIIYKWDGFLQPINDTAHDRTLSASVFKAGSTIPVKFQLKKTDGTIIQALHAPIWLLPEKGSSMSQTIDESVYSDAGTTGSEFKFDSGNKQYIYNWSTKGLQAGYWYKISIKMDDETLQSINIGLK